MTERYIRSTGTTAVLNDLAGFIDCIEAGDAEAAVSKITACIQSQLEGYRSQKLYNKCEEK